MPRVTGRTVAIAALGLLVGGCSLLVNLADTTGGGGAGATSRDGASTEADAGGDAVVAGGDGAAAGGDAGAEVGRVDGSEGPGGDGGLPDGARRAYPPGSWCAANAATLLFCDDFDDGPLGSRWTGTTLEVAGAATLSPTNYRSAPYGFDIACPALTPSTFLLEVLTESIPSASRITLAFDFDPVMFPNDGHGGPLYLATLMQGPGTPRSAIQFRAGTSLTDLQEQVVLESGALKTGTGQWESATIVPTGSWTHVEMDVDFAASPATAALRLNGQTVATGTLDSSWKRAPATVDLGDWYIPSEPAFHVAYDNVTIDAVP